MKKRVIGGVLLLVITLACTVPAWGDVPEAIEENLPREAQKLLENVDGNPADASTLGNGLQILWDKVCNLFPISLRESIGVVITLLTAVFLHGLAQSCFQTADHPAITNFMPVAFVLTVTIVSAGNVQTMIGTGIETMAQLDLLGKAMLPTLAAAVAAGGGIVSAGVCQVATVFFANLILSLIQNMLLPMVYFYIAAVTADAMLPEHPLHALSAGIKKMISWSLTGMLVLFTTYLSLSGALAASADATTLRLTRSAISAAVPVVGGIIAEATGSILSGTSLLKNSLGVFGMLAVLAICLTPFVTMAVQYLLYKLTAFLAGTAGGGTLAELINALAGAFGLVLGMVGTCALLLLISVASSVSVVIA